jgi:DNA-dependent RNA polymerase auxiliary subunit epsilon
MVKTNILLAGNNESDGKIETYLTDNGFHVEYVCSEQDLVVAVHKNNRKIQIILISQILKSLISDNILRNIHIPFLIIGNDIEKIKNDIEKVINQKNNTRNIHSSDELIEAFALHEIICDENGQPVDYRFLDADTKFLKRINKTKEELIGKTALELFPNTEKIWIETFGRVALSGIPESLMHYSVEFKNYYEARIYSPERGKSLALFIDVDKIKDKYH